ncbi:MAG: hypothetical protein AAFO82_08015 [Bacteroidota bacterium]
MKQPNNVQVTNAADPNYNKVYSLINEKVNDKAVYLAAGDGGEKLYLYCWKLGSTEKESTWILQPGITNTEQWMAYAYGHGVNPWNGNWENGDISILNDVQVSDAADPNYNKIYHPTEERVNGETVYLATGNNGEKLYLYCWKIGNGGEDKTWILQPNIINTEKWMAYSYGHGVNPWDANWGNGVVELLA